MVSKEVLPLLSSESHISTNGLRTALMIVHPLSNSFNGHIVGFVVLRKAVHQVRGSIDHNEEQIVFFSYLALTMI
jgi:hypothetical protein